MAKRHSDAIAIQLGAVNPSGICHSIVDACKEVREEGGDVQKDAAIRLMAHQLAHICGVDEINTSLTLYSQLTEECGQKIRVVPDPLADGGGNA